MPATRATVTEILKDWYVDAVQEQLNNETLVYSMFESMTVTWSGQQCVIPLHISRNTAVGPQAENTAWSGPLAAPGQQGWERLNVAAEYVYGRGQITGPAIASAKSDRAAFLNTLDAEMTGLTRDVKNLLNRYAVSGNRVKGFIPERRASGLTAAPQTAAGFLANPAAEGAFDEFQYDGDLTEFANVVQTNSATYVPVLLFRTDNYAPVTLVGAPANENFLVTNVPAPLGGATPSTNGTIEIGFGANAANDGWTSADITTQTDGVIVVLKDTQARETLPAGPTFGAAPNVGNNGWNREPVGIFGNLFDPDAWFGIDRSLAANAELRSNFITMQTVTPTIARGGATTDLTLTRLQQVVDTVALEADEEPDCILINHLQRQQYVATLSGFLQGDATQATKGDGGYLNSGLYFKGMPIKVSKDVPNGMWIFLKKMYWRCLEMQSGGFADLDGNILDRGTGDDWLFFWRMYYNTACVRPNAQAILSGVNLTAT